MQFELYSVNPNNAVYRTCVSQYSINIGALCANIMFDYCEVAGLKPVTADSRKNLFNKL